MAVLSDCHERPGLVAGYSVLLLATWICGWYEFEGVTLPIYCRSGWTEVAFTQETSMVIPDPPLHGIDWWRVEAIDAAGNRSDEPCP